MSKSLDAIKAIGEEVKMPNLLDRIKNIGRKRTKTLDEAGINSKQAVVKTEDGKEYPARCYAYVPDVEKVDTWKLRMCAVGTTEITREQLGAAAAAFSEGGHRGEKVQLPSEDVAKVKAKIRSEYAKLDVEKEDMPESIKMLTEVKDMDELLKKLKAATKSMHEDMREKVGAVLDEMEKAESDQVGLVRQLAEVVAQVGESDVKAQLEEIVNAMLAMLEESDGATEEEEAVEEEVSKEAVEDEVVETEEEVKKLDATVGVKLDEKLVGMVVEKLQIKELSTVIENHDKALAERDEGLEKLTGAVAELVNKIKALTDEMEAIKSDGAKVEGEVKELQKEDEVKVAEKQARFTPFWASQYQASKAASTVLDEDESKKYSKPEVPSIIQSMTRRYTGGN